MRHVENTNKTLGEDVFEIQNLTNLTSRKVDKVDCKMHLTRPFLISAI
jgi:hypothetical protein